MLRALLIGLSVLVVAPGMAAQPLGVLRVKVSLADAESRPAPVARHMLLVSENPASAAPRVMITGPDGTAELRVRPGNYTVESDKPVVFLGKGYQWTQIVDVVSGRDTVVEMTAANAEGGDIPVPPAPSGAESDPTFLLSRWQDSVLALWTPTTHASGVLVDEKGLVVTNQRVVGTAPSVEVQITGTRKVQGVVLAADAVRDVAVLWINPKAAAPARPLPLPCSRTEKAALIDRQEIFTIGAPFREAKRLTSGSVVTLDGRGLVSDLLVVRGAVGGPVFTAAGDVIGISSTLDEKDQTDRGTSRIVRDDFICDVIAVAAKKMAAMTPPAETPLPVEPARAFPIAALRSGIEGKPVRPSAYKVPSETFDVALITPVQTFAARVESEQSGNRPGYTGARLPDADQLRLRTLAEFSNWSEYVADNQAVLMIRVTPRLVESFWTTVGRVAASTQGVALPPIKHFKAGFGRLRALCGDAEVTPIHPFKIEQRLSETEAIYEGLYVFDPGALGPHCGSVKLVLFSEKEPQKGETRVVDPAVVQQVWDDFGPFRGQ